MIGMAGGSLNLMDILFFVVVAANLCMRLDAVLMPRISKEFAMP